MSKQRTQISYGEVQSQEIKQSRVESSSIVYKSQIGLQLWKT
jgi:hypothetical protein